jgi:hypothetical protein
MVITLEQSGGLLKRTKGGDMQFKATDALLEQFNTFIERRSYDGDE